VHPVHEPAPRAPRRSLPARVLTGVSSTPATAPALVLGRARPRALALAFAFAALACAQLAASPAQAAPASVAQLHYLSLAQAGVAGAKQRWRDPRRGWYDARLGDRERYPLATIWDIVPLFESLDAIAIAQPTAANRRAVLTFASGAERYLNRGLRPLPGYSPYQGDREAGTKTWFDDNGWWGLAFVNAYRATGARRYLGDATRALAYIAAGGWDPAGGGIWWNTDHPYKAGEALASATLLATLLYQQTRSPFALAQAQRFLTWADSAGFSAADGLYAGSSLNATPIDYIEGPLIYARALLCRLAAAPAECAGADRLKRVALARFGSELDFSPQYDAIYLQWMLALYGLNHDPALYRLAAHSADEAQARARDASGLYLRSWRGETLPVSYAQPGMLQTQSATSSVFAWLAVYPPP
jgi:hypothetical protein